MANQSYDAIVVGSGISGGWAAKELTEKGLKVLLLERGPNVEHVKDYKNATKAPWEVPHRGRRTIEMLENHPNLRRDYVLNELNLDWWAHEDDSPYVEKSHLHGLEVIKLEVAPCYGGDKVTDGQIQILRQMPNKGLL